MWVLIILSLLAYICWRIFVAKIRRDNSLVPIINELIKREYHDWIDFPHLKYEDVKKYAMKNDGRERFHHSDTSSTELTAFDFRAINAVYYTVIIRKLLDGSVSVMVAHDTENGLLQYDYALNSDSSYSDILSSLISQAVDDQVHAIAPYVKYESDKVDFYCRYDVETVRAIEYDVGSTVLWLDYKDQEDIPVTIYKNKAGALAVSPWRAGVL